SRRALEQTEGPAGRWGHERLIGCRAIEPFHQGDACPRTAATSSTPPDRQDEHGKMTVTCGTDWASDHHDAALADSASIVVPASPAAAVPPGTYAYVTHDAELPVSGQAGALWAIDVATGAATQTLPPSTSFSRGVAVSPDGTRVYQLTTLAVRVVDTATDTVIANISLGGFGSPLRGLAVSPDDSRLYVGTRGGQMSVAACWLSTPPRTNCCPIMTWAHPGSRRA
uniref:YncE family protein n=1 Tax=Streptomyces sp. NRRL F-2664 TaxID=1463842 RepID=UPI001F45646E